MKKEKKSGLVYYQSQILLNYGFDNFFFSRYGGISKGSFAELNMSKRVGDEHENVKKNIEIIENHISAEKLIFLKQMHGSKVIELCDKGIDPQTLRDTEADGIVTNQPGIAIGVLCADCFPVLIAEPEKKIIGICHCGRRGIVEGIIENTLQAMVRMGGDLSKMIVAIGPGICGRCYYVDNAVISDYQKRFSEDENRFWRWEKDRYYLDLKQAILVVLEKEGIFSSRIDDAGLCTFEDRDFFSHRRSAGKTGRQLSAIMIK